MGVAAQKELYSYYISLQSVVQENKGSAPYCITLDCDLEAEQRFPGAISNRTSRNVCSLHFVISVER